ncbi:MAG: hypothetical protein ACKOEC_18280, partial [Acidimicrobiia bacterium]
VGEIAEMPSRIDQGRGDWRKITVKVDGITEEKPVARPLHDVRARMATDLFGQPIEALQESLGLLDLRVVV